MFVTNLTKRPQGIDGIIILGPEEQNRYIEVMDNTDILARIDSLEHHKIISVLREDGLVKSGVDTKIEDEVKVEAKPEVEVKPEVEGDTEGKVTKNVKAKPNTAKDSK